MSEQLVTIGSYNMAYEANLVKGELEAFNLHPVIADDHIVDIDWFKSGVVGGVKVQVPESEVDEARRVLALKNGEEVDPDRKA